MIFRSLAGALAILLASADVVPAEGPRPAEDFTFKRVGIPKSGEKRLNVQIAIGASTAPEPPAPRATEQELAADRPSAPTTTAFDWFWAGISPDIRQSSPGRLPEAVRMLEKGPGGARVGGPRLQVLKAIADRYGTEILKATIGTDVSPALALAVMSVESSGQVAAVSPKGATGLMQLMPATAERFGVRDIRAPAENIKGGVAFLNFLLREFDRDPVLVLAGYNAGENAVKKHQGVPPYAETRAYVPKVLAAWVVARALCLTPPELITDGCVFQGETASLGG